MRSHISPGVGIENSSAPGLGRGLHGLEEAGLELLFQTVGLAVLGLVAVRRRRLQDVMGRDWALGYLLLLPAIAVLVGLIAYPFLYALFLSVQNKPIRAPGTFACVQHLLTL